MPTAAQEIEHRSGQDPARGGRSRRMVVVANRLPVRRVGEAQAGDSGWKTAPGGLVSALRPLLTEQGGGWVGWDGSAADADRPMDPFTHEGIRIRPVSLSSDELSEFYDGFSNGTIWPLYHDCLRAPQFHRRWWRAYEQVNRRFADAALDASEEGDIVWVHDYQLQLVPRMIRQRRPGARIGFFNHIPFPPEELFAQLPWRAPLLEGLLGADVVGFQTRLGAKNFARAARLFTGAEGTDRRLEHEGRSVLVDAFPISIDAGRYARMAREPKVLARAAALREEFGGRRIVLGVDRLDYTKGIDVRLRAFEEVLNRGAATVEDTVFVQIAVPTRERVDDYAGLKATVEGHVGRINGTHGRLGRAAVHYAYRSVPFDELVACYVAADVMVVTPLRDGMNLVAKEYVAARTDDSGVLVLSEFAGAALELRQALLVNPHDVDGIADALVSALRLGEAQARRRMGSMRKTVIRHDVYAWSDSFLRHLCD